MQSYSPQEGELLHYLVLVVYNFKYYRNRSRCHIYFKTTISYVNGYTGQRLTGKQAVMLLSIAHFQGAECRLTNHSHIKVIK